MVCILCGRDENPLFYSLFKNNRSQQKILLNLDRSDVLQKCVCVWGGEAQILKILFKNTSRLNLKRCGAYYFSTAPTKFLKTKMYSRGPKKKKKKNASLVVTSTHIIIEK